MRSLLRAAMLLLPLLVSAMAGTRTAAASCCDADCDLPCCDRDDAHTTMVPVLPCCHTDSVGRASIHPPTTTVENEARPLVSPALVVSSLVAIAAPVSLPSPRARLLPAPPLYHRYCALLL